MSFGRGWGNGANGLDSNRQTVNVLIIVLKTRTGVHKLLVRITNRIDPDQTASFEAV